MIADDSGPAAVAGAESQPVWLGGIATMSSAIGRLRLLAHPMVVVPRPGAGRAAARLARRSASRETVRGGRACVTLIPAGQRWARLDKPPPGP